MRDLRREKGHGGEDCPDRSGVPKTAFQEPRAGFARKAKKVRRRTRVRRTFLV
jgi:hypothetical protein